MVAPVYSMVTMQVKEKVRKDRLWQAQDRKPESESSLHWKPIPKNSLMSAVKVV